MKVSLEASIFRTCDLRKNNKRNDQTHPSEVACCSSRPVMDLAQPQSCQV